MGALLALAVLGLCPGEFRSIDDVRSWAAATFPALRPERCDLAALPVASWRLIAPELDHLAHEWPGVAARLEELQPKDSPWRVGRHAADIAVSDSGRGRYLAFSPRFWARPASAVRESLRVAGGSPPEAVIRHEWGHLVDGWLAGANPSGRLELIAVFRDRSGRFDREIAGEVSPRAAASEAEAFAEAFAEASAPRSGPARRFAEALAHVHPPQQGRPAAAGAP